MTSRGGFLVLALCAASAAHGLAQSVADLLHVRRNTGQEVVPVFEGWEPNADGTFSLYFGYQNRNWEEDVDIPIGPDNFFEPGPRDRGQPTHFLRRRHKINFAVVVPSDFGDREIVWTLSVNGRTERAVASLADTGGRGQYSPQYQISKSEWPPTGNRAPTLTPGPAQTVVFPPPATVVATVRDDGLPRRSPPALTVTWRKYRGPGDVTFDAAVPPLAASGESRAMARFSEPGVYLLQALADDGSMLTASSGSGIPGYTCCWTTVTVQVTVTSK